MGGTGTFVWPSFAITVVVLVTILVASGAGTSNETQA